MNVIYNTTYGRVVHEFFAIISIGFGIVYWEQSALHVHILINLHHFTIK